MRGGGTGDAELQPEIADMLLLRGLRAPTRRRSVGGEVEGDADARAPDRELEGRGNKAHRILAARGLSVAAGGPR